MQSIAIGVTAAGPTKGARGEVEARSVDQGPITVTPAQAGLWAWLATVTMLFAGFTSALLIRRSGSDWRPIPTPPILWLNTAVLMASSVTLEVARFGMKQRRNRSLKLWLLATAALGIAFLAGQLAAWRELAARGIYLPTGPHSSFFYMLTGVHGAHLAGGILALVYTLRRAWRARAAADAAQAVNLCATYWHFVGGIWLYLFVLLFG